MPRPRHALTALLLGGVLPLALKGGYGAKTGTGPVSYSVGGGIAGTLSVVTAEKSIITIE